MDRDQMGIVGAVVIIIILLLVFGGGMFGGPGDGDGIGPGGGIGDPCASDDDCAPGLICVDGTCQDASCGPGGTCPPGFICVDGTCVDGSCGPEDPCPEGFICIGGFCFPEEEPECETDADCEGDMVCDPELGCICGECTADTDCPEGNICDEDQCCVPEEETGCDEDNPCPDGYECDEETEDCICLNECTGDIDCPPFNVCDSGCCTVDPFIIDGDTGCEPCTNNADCEEGYACVGAGLDEGCCILVANIVIPDGGFGVEPEKEPETCEDCPPEDSFVTMMFLSPDLEEKTCEVTLVAELPDGDREVVGDATVFVEVLPADGSPGEICRVVTGSSTGTATFAYGEHPMFTGGGAKCVTEGCKLAFVFCCADVNCLMDECFTSIPIEHWTEAQPCTGTPVSWPEQATIGTYETYPPPPEDGDIITLYPAIDDISIPPEPPPIGAAFSFQLCLPVMAIFGLLSAAMYASGRNPFQMFSLYNPRFKRAPQRAIRARGMNWNINAVAGAIAGAVMDGKKVAQGKSLSAGRTLGSKAKGLKKRGGKIKMIREDGRRIGKGGVVKPLPKGARVQGTSSVADGSRGVTGARGSMEAMAFDDVGSSTVLQANALGFGAAFGATFGSAFLGKLLGGSAITSWLVYGAGDFKGFRQMIKEGMEKGASVKLFNQMATVTSMIDPVVESAGTDKDGNQLFTLETTDENGERVKEGPMTEQELAQKIDEKLIPSVMVGVQAAEHSERALVEEGNNLHDAQKDAIEAGAPIFSQTTEGEPLVSGEPIKQADATEQLNAEGITAAEVPGTILLSDDTKNLEQHPNGKTYCESTLLDTEGGNAYVADFEAKVQDGTVTQDELRAATEVFKKVNGDLDVPGASYQEQMMDRVQVVGADGEPTGETVSSNLERLGNAIVVGASEAAYGYKEGEVPGQVVRTVKDEGAAAFATYANSVVADAAIEGENAGLRHNAMYKLGEAYDAAKNQIEYGEVKDPNLVKMVQSFGDEGDPTRYVNNHDYITENTQMVMDHVKYMLNNTDAQGRPLDDGLSAASEFVRERGGFVDPSDPYNVDASRKLMIETLAPGTTALAGLDPTPSLPADAGQGEQPPPPPWEREYHRNEAENTAEIKARHEADLSRAFAQAAAAKMDENLLEQGAGKVILENGTRLDLSNSRQVETYVKRENPDLVPLENRAKLDKEIQKIYDAHAQGTDYGAARQVGQTEGRKLIDPLEGKYGAPADDKDLQSRNKAFDELNAVIKGNNLRGADHPAISLYDKEGNSQRGLFLALGSNPPMMKDAPEAMQKEFDEVAKVEAANKERWRAKLASTDLSKPKRRPPRR